MIFRSPHPDIEIPDVPITDYVLRHSTRLASKAALIDSVTRRSLSYADLAHAIDRTASGLADIGVRQGDVVAVYAPNSIEHVIAFHAIASLGAIVSEVNHTYLPHEVAQQLRAHHGSWLITTDELLNRAEEAASSTNVRQIVVIGEAGHHLSFASLLESDDLAPRPSIEPGTDVVAILSSSGTTGAPKGVLLTHTNLVAMAAQAQAVGEATEHDVFPGQLPFFHAFGVLTTLTSVLAAGATSVILARFELGAFLQLIQEFRVTRTFAVPPILVQLAKAPIVDDYDLSSLSSIACGAAPLSAELEEAVTTRIGCRVKQGYGMTEIVPTHFLPHDAPPSKQGSVGVCVANTETRVVDPETGLDRGPGQPGELWHRGPQAMKGYLDQPEATAATKDAGGWIHSGDLGYVDEDGYFYIVDRLKELIKYKAYQIAPAELEALLLTHPSVADAAVVRYPDDDAGEIPKAFVVARSPIEADELMAWVAERVAPYKKVRRVEFIDAIPKSAAGKILRRELIERDRLATPVVA
jgi:acyl-CoA synthetase (AMP-forming)/AMP-acid ligase II